MKSQRHFFENTAGEKLGARLDFPDGGSSRACALFAHCFTCSKNLKAVGNISQALTEEGIAVLRFDFADTNFSSNVADLISAADFLKSELDAPRILIEIADRYPVHRTLHSEVSVKMRQKGRSGWVTQ